ncbi:MAG: hypothetical protein GX234_10850 [Clostridiales bacterium]|nr:hypothetical protein [Clostridiales bacterium]
MADLQTGPAVPKQATPRMERIEAVVSGTEEAVALTKQGIEAHATSLVFQGDAGTYQAIVKTVSEQLYAPLQNYEEATIKGLAVKQRGRNCTAEIRRVSTIEEENAVDAAVAELVPQFNQGSTSDRVIAVHDFICNTVTYSNETAAGAADYKSAYDALASGQGVCTSYALLFQKFMDQMGIPCYIAVGNRNGVGHAWNIVQVDGQWYHMDCTWDDQSYGIIRKWCLAGSGDAGYASWGGVEIARERYR